MVNKNYFSSFFERIVLWVPVLGLIAALLDILFLHIRNYDRDFWNLFSSIFLLDAIHIGLPFAMIFGMPVGRQLLAKKIGNSGKGRLVFPLVIGLMFTIGVYSNFGIANVKGTALIFLYIILSVLILLRTWHTLRQSFGLSLLINKSLFAHLDEKDRAELIKLESKERRLFQWILLSTLLTLPVYDFTPRFVSQWKDEIRLAASFVTAFLVVYFIKTIALHPVFKKTHKFHFSLRFLNFSILHYSCFAPFVLVYTHSMEYLGIVQKLLRQRELAVNKICFLSIAIFMACLGICISITIFWVARAKVPETWQLRNTPILLFVGLQPFFSLLHYWADRVIYKTGDPDVQMTFAPHLISFANS